MNFKKHIASLITLSNVSSEDIESMISAIEDITLGDFTLPCFRFAKAMHMSPQAIAEQVADECSDDEFIEEVTAVNGYCNFYLNRVTAATAVLSEINGEQNYGSGNIGQGKTICIDYSSINIAKPFHIGHLGTTAIGNSLYKLYKFLGYNVVGINHLGDWGTQFGKLIVAYLKWGNTVDIERDGLRALQEIYVRFHVEADADESLNERARKWFALIEQGDEKALEYFDYFKKITLDEVKKIYQRLDINFDSWNGESFYNDKMAPLIEDLKAKGLTTVSDGALIVDLSAYNMPPCLLVKSDGASLYATRDIATAIYRKNTYDFDKCLYVVAYQQNLHFKQFFKVLEMAGYDWAKDLVHVAYGMVSLEEGSMSTRKGNTIWLSDVLDKAVEKASAVINEKSPDLENKEQIAEQVGVGAVMFSALANGRIKDIVFNFDRILNFEGETSPYLQYTHARCCSLLNKAGNSVNARIAHDSTVYDNDESIRLIKQLNKFSYVIVEAATKYEPSILANYLIDTAQAFNKYYFEHRILSDDLGQQNAKMELVKVTKTVLSTGLGLLGISAPTKM